MALTAQDHTTLRVAAWGAVSLMSAAAIGNKPGKAAVEGSIALTSATGPIGHVLAKAPKSRAFKGKSVAELADQVLPALTEAMHLLTDHNPADAADFRNTVIVATQAAARTHQAPPTPTMADMTRKITQALDVA